MKIAICLPSLNEAKNIRNITEIVDRGLSDFVDGNSGYSVEIVNVDSNSDDSTPDIFLNTNTKFTKKSIVIKDVRGKGRNILEFCKYVINNKIDYCLTIDTDIVSGNPEWISKMLTPLIYKDSIYVTPVYQRSRFEGSSTNHFACPMIYALTGKFIRQPIAGDFAFTNEVAEAIYKNDILNKDSILCYGIDIFMTVTAIKMGGKITQVLLGKKQHSPSFNKLEYMFPQISSGALLTLQTDINYRDFNMDDLDSNILHSTEFPHKNAAIEMKHKHIKILEKKDFNWLSNDLKDNYISLINSESDNNDLVSNLWVDILIMWFNFFKVSGINSLESNKAGEDLLPFFVLRATHFWFWSETVDSFETEQSIVVQAKNLRDKIKKI